MGRLNPAIKKSAACWLCCLLLTGICIAEEPEDTRPAEDGPPLWELGLFNAVARLPHYRGSDEYELYALPLPYFIYRGEILQADREGVRGIFFKSERFESSISLYGNPPVEDDNDAREGMDELDALFEIGPSLKWFFSGRAPANPLWLQVALRAALSVGFDSGPDLAYQGLHGSLNLIYQNTGLFRDQGIRFGLNAGIDFADSELNSYFYDVEREFVRPDRPFYNADSGYAGFSLSGSVSKKLTRSLSLGLYGRWDNVSGTVSDDSPLVKEENNFVLGAALTWKILESERRAASAR